MSLTSQYVQVSAQRNSCISHKYSISYQSFVYEEIRPHILNTRGGERLMLRIPVLCPLLYLLQTTSKNPASLSTLRMTPRNHQIIYAPSDESPRHAKSLVLAGSTTSPDDSTNSDWRTTLSASFFDLPVTIYNPYRPDWDSSWREDIDFAPFREQVEWELDKQDKADVVVVYFHPATQAPVSLLELGIWSRTPGKVIAICPKGYWKRGNVQIACKKFDVKMMDNLDGLRDAIVKKLFMDTDLSV